MTAALGAMTAALGLACAACGGARAGVATSTTPASAAPVPTVVVASSRPPGPTAAPGRRALVVEPRPTAAQRAEPAVARARHLAVGFENEQALAAVGEAQILLETEAATEEDYAALQSALATRGLIESNLDHAERAEQALRAAARLRPDAELPEVSFPPDLRASYARLVAEARAARPAALTVTTEPTGARILLDGVEVGASPATVSATPGQHYLRIEATGYASRVLAVTLLADGSPPLSVRLPPAGAEEVARQLLALPEEAFDGFAPALRRRLAEALDARVVVRLDPSTGRGLALDLQSGEVHEGALDTGAPGDPLAPLVAGLGAPPGGEPSPRAEEGSSGLLASPWLWVTVGLLAAGAGVGAYLLLTRDAPPPLLRVDSAP